MTTAAIHRPLDDVGSLVGRVLLGLIFVWFGVGKVLAPADTIASFAKMGLPVPALAYAVTIAIEVGGGLMFIIGYLTRPMALILAFWCIATALAAHSNFADRNMLIHFYKNVSMCGGFICAALIDPGRFSIDAIRPFRR